MYWVPFFRIIYPFIWSYLIKVEIGVKMRKIKNLTIQCSITGAVLKWCIWYQIYDAWVFWCRKLNTYLVKGCSTLLWPSSWNKVHGRSTCHGLGVFYLSRIWSAARNGFGFGKRTVCIGYWTTKGQDPNSSSFEDIFRKSTNDIFMDP